MEEPDSGELIYANQLVIHYLQQMPEFDDRGNIGKRYRRQDEIGTPFCVTYDFDSEEDGAVTVRFRDSMEQVRVKIDELDAFFADKFDF